MSTPGKDNLSDAQRKKQNSENQKASAVGNKPVESASAKTEEPQLRSVNETPQYVAPQYVAPKPQTNSPAPLLSNEQIAANRQEYKDQVVQQAIQQGMALPATERTVETSTLGPMNQKEYRTDSYDEAAARERMNNSSWLKDMNDRAEALRKEYEGKKTEASRQAKTAAWGNLFSALGQLAGAGKNTYVKADNKYLTDALSKADKAREMYDAIKTSNQKSIDDAKAKWLANDQALFYKDREAYNKMVKEYNDQDFKIAKETGTKTKVKYSNDDTIAAEKLALQKRNADIAERRAKATEKGVELREVALNQKSDKAKKDAEDKAFINYKDNDVMQNYNLNESEALRIANYLIKNKGYTMDKLGLTGDVVNGVFTVQNRSQFKGQVLDFLDNADWANEPAVLAIMNNSDNYPFGTDEERYGNTGWAGAPKAD